jgi:hypothetical protein
LAFLLFSSEKFSKHAALSALPAEERDALVRYLKTEVSLKDFEKAA